LRFEPIHRVIFTSQASQLARVLGQDPTVARLEPMAESEIKTLLSGSGGQDKAGYFDGESYHLVHFAESRELPPALVDGLFQRFCVTDPTAKIDFIHGWDDARKLAGERAATFFVPVLERDRLFARVAEHGPLPRKAFSMGDAEEKRFYMEARRITL
jgi:hypothetical protein